MHIILYSYYKSYRGKCFNIFYSLVVHQKKFLDKHVQCAYYIYIYIVYNIHNGHIICNSVCDFSHTRFHLCTTTIVFMANNLIHTIRCLCEETNGNSHFSGSNYTYAPYSCTLIVLKTLGTLSLYNAFICNRLPST